MAEIKTNRVFLIYVDNQIDYSKTVTQYHTSFGIHIRKLFYRLSRTYDKSLIELTVKRLSVLCKLSLS
jgi:hypothetical protein